LTDVESKFELFASDLGGDENGLVVVIESPDRNDTNLARLADEMAFADLASSEKGLQG
jgi:hypothetical protein